MNKKLLSILPFFFISVLLFSSSYSKAQCNTDVGIYYWGGSLYGVDSNSIIPTAKKLADSLGVHSIRITLACNDDNVYRATGKCTTGINLTSLAKRADFNAIIADPQFTTVIITAYDWTSFGDCSTTNFVDTAFYTPAHTIAIEQEYTNLANYLKTFSSKKFIIANWEADNQIYCGSAYSDPNCSLAPEYILGYKKWAKAKEIGIHAASAANVKMGLEFCNIHSLEAAGKPSVLDSIVPYINTDYFLYSSYESINVSAAQTDNDITFIRKKLAAIGKDSTKLIIGEMGFGAKDWGSDTAAANRLQAIINVLNKRSIPIGIVWVLIDHPDDFGAYDSVQAITAMGKVVKNSVCITTSIEPTTAASDLQLHIVPNPSHDKITIRFNRQETGTYTLEIRNELGQLFYSEQIESTNSDFKKIIPLQNFSSGMYFIQLRNAYSVITEKLLVN